MLQLLYSFSSKLENTRVFCSVDQQFYALGVNYYYYEDNGGGGGITVKLVIKRFLLS